MNSFIEKQKRYPFGRLHRLQRNHQAVKDALSSGEAADIIDKVPVFARSYFHDTQHSALELINKHDLAVVIKSARIPNLAAGFSRVSSGVEVLSTLTPPPKLDDVHFETHDMFLAKPCVKIGVEQYSIKDFLFSILYTSGVHALPEDEKLLSLYEKFVEEYPQEAIKLLTDVGRCLVSAVDFLHELNESGRHDLLAMKNGAILKSHNGNLTKGPGGQLRGTFQNSDGHGNGMQMLIKKSDFIGLALTSDIRLSERNSKKIAFLIDYGHRNVPESRISIFQKNTKVFIQVGPNEDGQIILDASSLTGPRSELRLEIFPSSEIVVFVTGQRIKYTKLGSQFKPVDGKITLGADLNGKLSGSFTSSYLHIDRINRLNICSSVHVVDMNKVVKRSSIRISPKDQQRRTFS